MFDKLIPAAISFVFGGLITGLFNYLIDKKKQANSNYMLKKRESYEKLVNTLRSALSGETGGKEKLLDELNYCWLYGSEKVINKCYDILGYMASEQWIDSEVIKDVEELLVLMRNDMGLKSKSLKGKYKYYRLIYDHRKTK